MEHLIEDFKLNINMYGGYLMDYKKVLIIIAICIITLITFASLSNYNVECGEYYPALINMFAFFIAITSSFYIFYSEKMMAAGLFIMIFFAFLVMMSIAFKRHPSPFSTNSLKGCKVPYFMIFMITLLSYTGAFIYQSVADFLLKPGSPKMLYIAVMAIGGAMIFLLCQLYWNWYNKKWMTFNSAFELVYSIFAGFFIDSANNLPKVLNELEVKFGDNKKGPFGSN